MKGEMAFGKQLYPPELGMSPAFAVRRFKASITKYGQQRVLIDSRFQKARELWATALFVMGVSSITQKKYWVVPEYDEQTPDTYAVSFASHSKYHDGKNREILRVEVSEYEQHAAGDLVYTIRQKLNGKVYPDDYVLLIQANRPGEKANLEETFQTLSKEHLNVGEIFLLASSAARDNLFTVVSLYKKRAQVSFSLDEELAMNSDQCEMITWTRGRGEAQLVDERRILTLPDL